MSFLSPRPLQKDDPVAGFECGNQALDVFIERFAFQNQQSQSAKTYVTLTDSGKLAGYYTLAYGSVEHKDAPERTKKGLAKHPIIPVMILARLAVDRKFRRAGLGKQLLWDALVRTLQASDIAGMRAIVAHAKDDSAKHFYERYGFEPLPSEPLKLALLLKDLRALIA